MYIRLNEYRGNGSKHRLTVIVCPIGASSSHAHRLGLGYVLG